MIPKPIVITHDGRQIEVEPASDFYRDHSAARIRFKARHPDGSIVDCEFDAYHDIIPSIIGPQSFHEMDFPSARNRR